MNQAEFVVNVSLSNGETLRGKFKVKIKLSYREILAMDAARRSYLGPQPGEPDQVANLLAVALAKVNTHAIETPSWWKEANNGADFDELDVILAVYQELQKVEQDYLAGLKKSAAEAGGELKKTLPESK